MPQTKNTIETAIIDKTIINKILSLISWGEDHLIKFALNILLELMSEILSL